MKGGHVPVHIQRWAAADYHADEHVKLLVARHDYRALTFYRHFLDHSFMAGGDLPADPEALAAVVNMPRKDVEAALKFCLGRLVFKQGDRLYQKRVRRDIAEEMDFRAEQSQRGRLGGRPKKKATAFNKEATGFDDEKPWQSHTSESPPAPCASAPADAMRHAPPPAPQEHQHGESGSAAVAPTGAGNGNGPPPAASSTLAIPHDPTDLVQAQLAKRCEELALREAQRPPTDVEVLEILRAVSTTPTGKHLTDLRGAPASWVAESLRACERFEEDLGDAIGGHE